jgi:hypothetical protein
MSGIPDWFDVTNLEILAPGDPAGSPMKEVVQLNIGDDPFDLLVTFEANPSAGTWWGLAEVLSDLNPGMVPAITAKFFVESVGPGPEFHVGEETIPLTEGGNVPDPLTNASDYQVRLKVSNVDALFVDELGEPAPGTYLVGCGVEWDIENYSSWFASGTFSGNLIMKAAYNG